MQFTAGSVMTSTVLVNSIKKKSVLEKMAEEEEERQAHRRRQEEKDAQFKAALEAIAIDSAKETHSLAETKRSIKQSFESRRGELKRRQERLREVERETSGDSLKERLANTWHNLELNSTAHELDSWCQECGCIHTSDVVNDE